MLLFSLSSLPLFAQISGASSAKNIMIKSNRVSKAKLSARITLDGYYQTGNTDKSNVSGSVSLSSVDSIKELSFNGRYLYGKNEKTVNQKEYIAGVQYDYHPFSVVSPFLRMEFYKNEFQKINGRYAGMAGMKYRYFVKPGILDYSVSAALLFDIERYEPDVDSPGKERFRISVRPKFKHNLTDNIYLIAEAFYKPNIKRFDDYIMCGNINLNIRVLTKGLLRLSYEHEYNNRPATNEIKKTDALLLVGLGVEF
jgi:putative salt-induced outer membrane protein YdiY